MAENTGKIIEQRKLENGMELLLYDLSRVMAGDRWLVELKCETRIPIDAGYWERIEKEEERLFENVRKLMGEHLVFATTKKRNFVDAGERDDALQEMVEQVYSSMLGYLQKPNFPEKLFRKQYHDARQKVLIQQAMQAGDSNR